MPDISPNLAPPDLTQAEFKTGYWLYEHHSLFKKIVVWCLVVVCVGLWGYASIKFISYLATIKAHEQMLVSLVGETLDTTDIHERNKAQDIEVVSVMAVPSGTNYDLVALVRNPNLQWSANRVTFTFTSGGEAKAQGEDFILPLAEKYIFVPDVDLPGSITDIVLSVDKVEWQRIKNFKDFPITDFTISKQQLDNLADLSDNSQVGSRLTFDLTNNSAYSFWQVAVVAILKSGAGVVGIASRIVDNFDSGQTQPLTFFWDFNSANVTNIEVKAEVNVLDQSVFKAL